MNLDINTLYLVTVYVEAILGLLLLFAWVQNTAITAVAWWGFAHLLRAASLALFGLYGSVPNIVSIDLANAILFTSFAVTWTGARLFDHRKPEFVLLFAGVALWLVACQIPGFSDTFDLRALLSSGIITAYTWAAAFEFWRGRSEPLVSRWPAICLLIAHGTLYLVRTPLGSLLPRLANNNTLLESVWFSALSFEALLFTIAIAFILLAMAKERAEYRHKSAAMIDPLTGISTRWAFLKEGEEHFSRQVDNPRPTAVMLLDLDNFKSINDRYGDAVGDQVLESFARVASSCLRRIDLFARLEGEEFAALLHDTPRDRALAVAEQIRSAFAAATRDVDGQPVAATVSIGIVVAHDTVLDLPSLLVQADHALYRAKQAGRNRIKIASIELILDRANRAPAGRLKAISAA
jgi:diguanylate cyclase (GGDEF)-like protein